MSGIWKATTALGGILGAAVSFSQLGAFTYIPPTPDRGYEGPAPAPTPSPSPTPSPTPAPTPVNLPVAPQGNWDARFSTVSTSGGRVTSASDLSGANPVSEGAAGIGPRAVLDSSGRPCWRFEGDAYLGGPTGFVADNRNITVFVVGRMHKGKSYSIFSLGNATAGTAVNGGNILRTVVVSSGAPLLYGGSISSGTASANAAYLVPGSQPQVIGLRSGVTANGGQRLSINGRAGDVAQQASSVTGVAGFEVGRNSFTPGASGTWAQMDVYKIVVYTSALTPTQCADISAALTAYYDIPEITDQILLVGDSITDGVGTVPSGDSLGMVATNPGSPLAVPKTTRVINIGVSGNTTVSLTTQRDSVASMFNLLLPGYNHLGLQIGRNNLGALAQSGATTYSNIVALINTASTGYLQRGWTVSVAVNIAVSSSVNTELGNLRTLLRSPQFLTDCSAGSGQAYDGKLKRFELPLVTSGASGTIFDTVADSTDTTWFQGDSTHPTVAGTEAMWSGADTPTNGYRTALV